MTRRVVCDVGAVAVATISGLRQCGRLRVRREGVRLYPAEALALEERSVGARAKGGHGDRCAVRFDGLYQGGLEAVVVHTGDSGDESYARIIPGGIPGVRAIGHAVQAEVVNLNVKRLLHLTHSALGLDVQVVFSD